MGLGYDRLPLAVEISKSKMIGLIDLNAIITTWGHSSVGRAPAWHAGGQGFESP